GDQTDERDGRGGEPQGPGDAVQRDALGGAPGQPAKGKALHTRGGWSEHRDPVGISGELPSPGTVQASQPQGVRSWTSTSSHAAEQVGPGTWPVRRARERSLSHRPGSRVKGRSWCPAAAGGGVLSVAVT